MRSLYVDDIQGAKPRRTIFDKSLFTRNYLNNMSKSVNNPEAARKFQWRIPQTKPIQPLQKNDDGPFRTKKTLMKSFQMSQEPIMHKSMILSETSQKPKQQKTSSTVNNVFVGSAQNSLNTSNLKKQNPYFPHRYIETNLGETNKWTGSRVWSEQPNQIINITSNSQIKWK